MHTVSHIHMDICKQQIGIYVVYLLLILLSCFCKYNSWTCHFYFNFIISYYMNSKNILNNFTTIQNIYIYYIQIWNLPVSQLTRVSE